MLELHVHLGQRLLHVLDVMRSVLHQHGPLAQVAAQALSDEAATRDHTAAQSFTTGSAASSLHSVQLMLHRDESVEGQTHSAVLPVVTVHADDSGDPDDAVLYTLTRSGFSSVSSTTPVLHTFNAPNGAALDASTTYWVVVSHSGAKSSADHQVFVDLTDVASVERVDTGWSLGNRYRRQPRAGGAWADGATNARLKLAVVLAVEALANREDGGAPTSGTLLSSVGQANTFGSLGSSTMRPIAQGFETGSSGGGTWSISSLTVRLRSYTGQLVVDVRDDNDGTPGDGSSPPPVGDLRARRSPPIRSHTPTGSTTRLKAPPCSRAPSTGS